MTEFFRVEIVDGNLNKTRVTVEDVGEVSIVEVAAVLASVVHSIEYAYNLDPEALRAVLAGILLDDEMMERLDNTKEVKN